jgi:NADPH-dependent 2,4-dienoyl-CoA reductase/sulfur reductase-like enzyme
MEHFELLIIGGVAAGMSAASQARRVDENMSIGVFEKGDYVSYGACGMPYLIDNLITDYNKLIAIDKDKYINERNIQIFTSSAATAVNFNEKTVTIEHGGLRKNYSWDKLVIATGARAVLPPFQGIENENVFVLRSLDDGLAIKRYIESGYPRKGIIVGGGAIGLEMAESLRTLGIETVMLEKAGSIASAFTEKIRERIIEELEKHNVTIKTGVDIKTINKVKDGLSVETNNSTIDTDFILISIGVRPNTEFLKNTGIKLDPRGAIIINSRSETNIPGVYAAGDCATVRHLIISEDVYMPLGTTSNKQGRVAGLQAAGVTSEEFKGIVGTQFVRVFDLEVAKTGFSETEAAKHNIKAESADVFWKSKAGYCPDSKKIYVKLTVNSETRELIGGETAGVDGAAQRANVIAAAITSKMKINDFAYLDLGYAPPFSPVWDSLLAAGQKLVKR